MADEECPGKKRPHGMAHQENRQPGKRLSDQLVAGEKIPLHKVPAAFWTEVEPGRTGSHRCTVAQVVMACHGNAPSRQKCGQRLIAQNVLRHTVGELQNSPDGAVRHPVYGVQGGFAVRGGDCEFSLEHGKTNLPVVYCH